MSAVDQTVSPPQGRIAAATAGARRRRLSSTLAAFLAIVVLPTLCATLYFGLVAAPRYTSEAKFIVRGVSGRHLGGLAALFRTFGISRAEDDAFAVSNFMLSRDAVAQLDKLHDLSRRFSPPGADLFSRYPRFWRGRSFESLFAYYKDQISVVYSPSTGLTTLKVRAFSAEDAETVAASLLRLSEALINRMNARATTDSQQLAQDELGKAERRVIEAQQAITAFRNRELLLDPTSSSLKVLELIGQLSVELAQAQSRLAEARAESPNSPMVNSLRSRIGALESQIALERSRIVGGDNALASKIAAYEQLHLTRDFADKALASAVTALDNARQEGRRQQLYIETVVKPSRPDEPTEPDVPRMILTVFVMAIGLYSMVWLVLSGSREHRNG